ncbi:MAG TPA: hypothetical protein DCS82_10750 [Rhodospirillaceae bacterium]|nr:hypothetical protein [Rhodospirillaceae bacterium]HAA91635.1 hypothetical protein [Rhodospirillaceae bacterium]HAT36187.1 hypothetical protein [Rhodospirillaceae bacterium]
MRITNRIDPDYLALVEQAIAETPENLHEMDPETLRNFRNAQRTIPPPPDDVAIENTTIDSKFGGIPVRIYRHRSQTGSDTPLILYFHGGGFVIGNLDTHQSSCIRLCVDTTWPVISVDYRRAPENPFPAAPEDCYAVFCWAAQNAETLGIDRDRIALVGESAGGNLATVAALMARDRNGPQAAFQLLFYPVTDCNYTTPSYQNFADGPLLPARVMQAYWRHYLAGDETTDEIYAAPLLAESLVDLPPAAIVTAEFDVLRSEAEAYTTRLKSQGVTVSEYRAEGLIHGFMKHVGVHPEAERVYSAARNDMIEVLNA